MKMIYKVGSGPKRVIKSVKIYFEQRNLRDNGFIRIIQIIIRVPTLKN